MEDRFLWFVLQFGIEPIARDPLHHDSTLLPKNWTASHEACDELALRLCTFMYVDPARISLRYMSQPGSKPLPHGLFGSSEGLGAAGTYQKAVEGDLHLITIEEAGLDRPTRLVATICYELGHVHLLGDGRIGRDIPDSEPLTDLLTIYFGAGIFNANASFEFFQWQDTKSQGWQASRLGSLTEQVFGYALACYAWFRGETKPVWRKYLRENILYYFDDSMHFLAVTKKTSIPFDGVHQVKALLQQRIQARISEPTENLKGARD